MKIPSSELTAEFNQAMKDARLSDTKVMHYETLMRHSDLSEQEKQEVTNTLANCLNSTLAYIATADSLPDHLRNIQPFQQCLRALNTPEAQPYMPGETLRDTVAQMTLNILRGERTTTCPKNVDGFYFAQARQFKKELAKELLAFADGLKVAQEQEREQTLDKSGLVSTGASVKPMNRITLGKHPDQTS
ncbi:MAG: hypothetical protein GC185_03280 [Alphaproteobacteria bacterium]|nr:hypothetical protein [Alphaproteobacteria bacterium]